ncbi:helix-turn-helix domain-containing protein [Dactylosporangium sp. CA-139066]|uniref:helix-turn-helix domain-containing protein n=1 Tax=Dactylosporangium sp. CA-139066 TaxID=3239930 RepID=UPI003D9429C2
MTGPTSFGALLRGHRHDRGLTLEELAAAAGVRARALGDMELGLGRRPRRRTVASIADALRLPPDAHAALVAAAGAEGGRGPAAPLEPPRTVLDFTGRGAELTWIAQLAAGAARAARAGGGATVGVVSGPPGVGKTALAVHAAGVLAERGLFPGGRFFLDLRGGDADPRDEEARHYRARPAEPRRLVILDDAADETQVRRLLPDAEAGLVLVTSRGPLGGLEGVHRLALGGLPPGDAAEFIGRLLGAGRAEREARAVAELAARCGGLPLALRIAGHRLASRPAWTVAHLLGRLPADEPPVEALLELSYRELSPLARRVFRRLGAAPGPDAGAERAAVLGQTTVEDAEDALEELVELGLLRSEREERYGFHDLVRRFARARREDESAQAKSGGWGASTVTRSPR